MYNTYKVYGYGCEPYFDARFRAFEGSAKFSPKRSAQIKNKKRRVNNRRAK
ncbi:MAG: hypothetical protein IJ341_02800 [Bacteroidales bacterium]|nr:hypothetical protein [Bacteroidales bacterium]